MGTHPASVQLAATRSAGPASEARQQAVPAHRPSSRQLTSAGRCGAAPPRAQQHRAPLTWRSSSRQCLP